MDSKHISYRWPAPAAAVSAALAALGTPAVAQESKEGLAGSYTLEVSSFGAKCPPIIRAPLVVGRARGNSIPLTLAGEAGTGNFYGGGLAFTARFAEFDMTGPVRASGEFQRYQGRILVDMTLRWPEGVDCTASLSGSRPEGRAPAPAAAKAPAPAPAAPAETPPPSMIGPSAPAQPAAPVAPIDANSVSAVATDAAPGPAPDAPAGEQPAEQGGSLWLTLLKIIGVGAVGWLGGLGLAGLIRGRRGEV